MTEHEKWAALREPFPHPQKVKKEWTDKKTGERKSITLDYIGHAVVSDRLLQVDPTHEFRPLRNEQGLPIIVLEGLAAGDNVGVWGELTILGTSIVEFCSGKDLMDAYSRCLCRCAMRRGVALDLWIKDDEFKAKPEVRKEGGLGQAPVPKTWPQIQKWYEDYGGPGAWDLAQEMTKAYLIHQYGTEDTKALTKVAREIVKQKAAGATVWLAENGENAVGPLPPSVELYTRAWAHVLGGHVLEGIEWKPPESEADAIAEEVFQG